MAGKLTALLGLGKLKTVGYGFIAGLVAGVGITIALTRGGPLEPVTETRVVYVEKPAPPPVRDAPLAAIRTLYLRRVDTVEVRIPVPVDFGVRGVIGQNPVSFTRNTVHVQYWSPDSLRFVRDTYRLRERQFGAWIAAETGKGPSGLAFIGASVNARYRRFSASLGQALTSRGPEIHFRIGYRLLGVH